MKVNVFVAISALRYAQLKQHEHSKEPVDDANHIIMDYSIHDAIEAGFNHVVFIIRKDIEKEFKEAIGDRIAAICSSHNVTVDYAFH